MKIILYIIISIYLTSCGEDSSSGSLSRTGDNENIQGKTPLEGSWGFPNFNFTFKDNVVTVVKGGVIDRSYSGEYFSDEEGVMHLKGSERIFLVDDISESSITIIFDDGFGGSEFPKFNAVPD